MTRQFVLLEGWLFKRKSDHGKLKRLRRATPSWTKRWFTVEFIPGSQGKWALCYYKDRYSEEPCGWTNLDDIKHVGAGLVDLNTFSLQSNIREFVVKCESRDSYRMWVAGLRSLCGFPLAGVNWPEFLGPMPNLALVSGSVVEPIST